MQKPLLKDKYFLTVNEAAAFFGFGQKKMRRIAESGQYNYSVKYCNRWLIAREKLENYIDKYYLSGLEAHKSIPEDILKED